MIKSHSSRQENVSSGSGLQINTGSSYVIKPKTMAIPLESFEVQVESPVDFESLKRNGMNLDALMGAQQLYAYKQIFSRPLFMSLMRCPFCPLYIYQSRTSHSLFTLFILRVVLCDIKIFFSQTENLEPPNLHQSSLNGFIKCITRNWFVKSESSSL